ncbi:phosphatase PAP2 family protein [Collinsella aerofaciens]|uniref:phosphatase PAP2 family protein n=1 Tax=Collinsella aerofaciens TaxID=74426 RepID=UPI00290A09EC|nr:phosphatase PAP2 family protein [Collinsella aerofaciens]MDU8610424.1 phosphatase PAP2 family protein [Collinsella aerofaciens]
MFGYIYKKDAAAIAVILALCLGVGTFFDYQISSMLFNSSSMYGRFIEAAGELPFELTTSVAGVMLVRSARSDSKASKWLAVLGILVNVGLTGYEIVSSLRVGGKLIAAQLVLTFVLAIVANLIVYCLTRTTEPDELTRWSLMVLAVWVVQAIILNVIVKPLWSRPRMRVIEVTQGLEFQPWWVIGNPDKWTYIAAGVIKDGFKSFASGHTAHAAIGLMLAGLPAAAFKEKPSRRRVVFWTAAVVAALVAFGRIVIGAHFLSDVSCGFALVLALECLAARIAYPSGVQWLRLNHLTDTR